MMVQGGIFFFAVAGKSRVVEYSIQVNPQCVVEEINRRLGNLEDWRDKVEARERLEARTGDRANSS